MQPNFIVWLSNLSLSSFKKQDQDQVINLLNDLKVEGFFFTGNSE